MRINLKTRIWIRHASIVVNSIYFVNTKTKEDNMKIGTIKRQICKQTARLVRMYYTGNLNSETGENGHKGWICLHTGGITNKEAKTASRG